MTVKIIGCGEYLKENLPIIKIDQTEFSLSQKHSEYNSLSKSKHTMNTKKQFISGILGTVIATLIVSILFQNISSGLSIIFFLPMISNRIGGE